MIPPFPCGHSVQLNLFVYQEWESSRPQQHKSYFRWNLLSVLNGKICNAPNVAQGLSIDVVSFQYRALRLLLLTFRARRFTAGLVRRSAAGLSCLLLLILPPLALPSHSGQWQVAVIAHCYFNAMQFLSSRRCSLPATTFGTYIRELTIITRPSRHELLQRVEIAYRPTPLQL